MADQQINGNLNVAGSITCQSLTPPAGCITAAAIEAAAGIEASKQEHQHEPVFRQAHGTAAAARREVLHVVNGATADLISFKVGNVVASIGNSTITVDLYKNGSSILSSTITLNSSSTAYSLSSGTFSSSTAVSGDVFEVVVTVSAGSGTLGQGVFASLVIREDAQ